MKWLSRLLGGSRRTRPLNISAQPALDLDVGRISADPSPPSQIADPGSLKPDLTTEVDDGSLDDALDEHALFESDEVETLAEREEDDPTLGRYEALDETTFNQQDLADMRALAELQALSAPHRINVWDATGPGSLAEISAHLESQGRLTSQIKDDPETGPYLFYEPVDRKES